ncbi:hypothetical protein BKA67DRAFT_561065 [Truncatella angustata]|uniref:Uncharacterized protein n=1 Tax=Truncatella angustata TaxID=152316 RepID=A0A9P8UNX2_9PEZI|nr:uncharacterized protein BKA67DRAFT_561065 [Truncatella angustata]KAH6655558.1 hypothetical protein BKA67DRAFT_561065 [Truncatella angustata]
MAGSVSDISLPGSSFFNIHTDGRPVTRSSPAPALPGGQCNYVDLAHGANGPRCGCRRFWSRGASGFNGSPAGLSGYANGGSQPDQSAFCMCSHHACFHDDVQATQGPPIAPVVNGNGAGQENERPRAGREPLTPVMPDLSFQMPPPTNQPVDLNTLNNASYSTNLYQEINLYEGEKPAPAPEPSMPDTMSWANLLQSQPEHQIEAAPSVPSQCLLPQSQPSSTTSSVRLAYLKPFGGKGPNMFNTPQRSRLREPLQIEADDVPPRRDELTGHSVPSVDDLQTVTNTPRSIRSARRATIPEPACQPAVTRPSREDFQDLSNTVQSHEDRIERLETVSFHNDHEDCHDHHEQNDLRVTDLESRVEELEKTLNDGSSATSSHHRLRRPGLDESVASVVSVSTNASGHTDRTGLRSELAALKAQISHIQNSSFPTHSKPYEVEVVFLPFPLKGIWYESREFPSQRPLAGSNIELDEWTQLPNSSSTMEPHSPSLYEWAGPELQSEWLLPRACASGNVVDQRLRSRGLIKTIAVPSPDARSVHLAVSAAFGTLFRTFSRLQASVYHGSTTHHRVSRFLGLQQAWVPLRKIHKDSRLRFLSPPEMITPTSWDVSFLSSSVVMKATGVHRLFITQPEAYLQDQDAYNNGWNWQRLRELTRVYPDSQSSQQEVPEADAMEGYWARNEMLDEQDSSQDSLRSLSLRQAAQPRLKSMTPSQRPLRASRSGPSPSLSTGRSRAGSPMVLIERQSSVPRPIYIRTTSMPPDLPPMASPSQARQRIASATFGSIHPRLHERRSSPQVQRASTGSAHLIAKANRRRSTRSPSVPLSARLRNTPRWSVSTPSPLLATMNISEPFAVISSEGEVQAACRQTTPFYYATPYSNAPPAETRSNLGVVEAEEEHGSESDYSCQDGQGSEDDSEDDSEDAAMIDLGHQRRIYEDSSNDAWQGARQPLPEDEPWPGIEDEENRDPEAMAFDNVDVYVDEDAMSDVLDAEEHTGDTDSQHSSVPSEYPTTQRAWTNGLEEFRVYEDTKQKLG